MDINIGINENDRKIVADALCALLADSYTLYLKTHNYHWNVTGPMFQSLHALFEEQYTELAAAVDEIAERVRSLGFPAPGSYQAFSKLTQIEEALDVPKAEVMIRNLVNDHETIIRSARELFAKVDEADDETTADLITERMEVHEKNAWMLRSHLE